MTTTRDDIDGLIERLQHLVSLNRPGCGGPYQGYAAQDCVKAMGKAATQLAALENDNVSLEAQVDEALRSCLAERERAEALSARVEELEGQLAEADATLLKLNVGKELQDLMRINNELKQQVEAFRRHEQTLRDNGIASHSEAVVRVVDAESRVKGLEAKLFPYTDAAEISGMSWSGFYLIGDKKSISELQRLENRSAQLEKYSTAYEERIAAAESRATRLQQEAYERAAKQAEQFAPPHSMDLGKGHVAWRIAAAIRQLAARNEKEGE